MDRTLDRFAWALTRAWVRRYTLGLPTKEREVRREQIESDPFEHSPTRPPR